MKQIPSFPAIQIFNGDDIIYGLEDSKEFFLCDLSLIDKLKESVLIDCKGRKFVIEEANKIGWGTILWGYNPLMKGRLAKVDYKYEEISDIDWQEFKDILLSKLKIRTDPIWYPNSKKIIMDSLKEQTDFKTVIDLFLYET